MKETNTGDEEPGNLSSPAEACARPHASQSPEDPRQTLNELRARQLELESQNEELRRLVLNNITERKLAEEKRDKLEGQFRQAQKMESVGRLASGVAHDFNNMLGVILGNVEMALKQVEPHQPLYADLTEIRAAAVRSAELTRQLLTFVRKQTVAPKVLNLNGVVAGILLILKRLVGEAVELAWTPEAELWSVKADPAHIEQILTNLCISARDDIVDVGKITLATENVVLEDVELAESAGVALGEYVRIVVGGDGCGAGKENLAHLFEPVFASQEADKGTSLGLVAVYGILKQNNGFITVHGGPGQGKTFKIHLPRLSVHAAQSQEAPNIGASEEALGSGQETILLVEDEPAFLKMTARMLQSKGYTVLTAVTPSEAIRLAQKHAGEIHLLLTDVVMSEMNGRDLAKKLLGLYPHFKRLFMSGYTANVIVSHGVMDDGARVHFIQKPFSTTEIALKVRQALDER